MDEKYYKMLEKIASEYNEYDWREMGIINKYKVDDVFPADISNKISTYYTKTKENLMFVVGSYFYKFYYEEDVYRKEKQEFISINIIDTDDRVKNLIIITSSDFQRYVRRNQLRFEMEDSVLKKLSDKNYVEYLYSKVNEKVNNFEDKFDSFMNG